MRIDHVIYATSDLDSTAARIESELGLAAVGGGRHDGLGTHNRIVPLGGGFLELLAIADAAEAEGSALGRAVSARLSGVGEGLMGWAVAVEDVAGVAVRLGLQVTTISRSGMTARLTGIAEAMREPSLPFFIERDPGVPDPGQAGDSGGITWLEVAADEGDLVRWLGGAQLPLRITAGTPGVRALGIGERVLRSG